MFPVHAKLQERTGYLGDWRKQHEQNDCADERSWWGWDGGNDIGGAFLVPGADDFLLVV